MSRKIVAIGGGENGRVLENGELTLYETEAIDREIVNLTRKENPNFLFIAHAMEFSLDVQESYYQTMKKIYGDKFGCNCKDLKTIDLTDTDKVKSLVEWADIIYEGGGDTASMINIWKKTNFDKMLFDAWNAGKVICGISAGAVCWFNSCNSDFIDEANNNAISFEVVDCLNWIHAFITPHSDEEGRSESTKEQLKNNNLVGIKMSNCSALEILDDKYKILSSSSANRAFKKGYVCKAYWLNNKYVEEKLDETHEFLPLNTLLKKDEVINK